MKILKNQHGVALILELILVAAVSAGLVFVYMNWQSSQQKVKETETNSKKASQIPAGYVEYKNADLGLMFVYLQEWGDVKLEKEDLYKGEGYRIKFSKKKESQGTIRSKNAEVTPPGGGRGGAYWDAPTSFTKSCEEQEWDADMGSVTQILECTDDTVVSAYCSDFVAFVGIDALVQLGGTKYDTAKFFYQYREPLPNGGGINLTGCNDVEKLVESVTPEYLKFIRTIQPIK